MLKSILLVPMMTVLWGASVWAYSGSGDEQDSQQANVVMTTTNADGSVQEVMTPSVARPIEYPASFQVSDFETKPWLKAFQYVIVVNKATEGRERQSVRIFFNGVPLTLQDVVQYLNQVQNQEASLYSSMKLLTSPNREERTTLEALQKSLNERSYRIRELGTKMRSADSFLVSTGRDEFEKKGEHHSQKDSWSVTPTGYYVPQYFTEKHKSESYSSSLCDSWIGKVIGSIRGKESCTMMENVIFFNEAIALHKAIPGTEEVLGNKASGGCVRLPAALSEFLFRNVKLAYNDGGVPIVDNAGNVQTDANGNVVLETRHKSIWGEMNARSALIIVKSEVVP